MRVGRGLTIWALCATGTLAGCGAPGDMFTAHPPLAATAGPTGLPADRLAELLTGLGKQVSLNKAGAELLADAWINYSLFTQAVTTGAALDDSATAAQAMWPQVVRARLTHWRDTLAAHRPVLPDSLADSADAAGRERVFQQLLVIAPPNAPAPQRAEAKNRASRLLARLDAGADFGELAMRYSDDTVGRAAKGVMPPAVRGTFTAKFDSVAWTLAPGQHSGVVESRAGFHIIRRPPLTEVRAKWMAYLTERERPRLDSIYVIDLCDRYGLRFPYNTPQLVRNAMDDREHALKSNRPLAIYQGGAYTERELINFIQAVGPLVVTRFDRMRDFEIMRFVKGLAQTKLVLQQADSAKVGITEAEWRSIYQQYRGDLDSLKQALRIGGSADADSARQPVWVEGRVNGLLDRIAAGTRSRPPGGGLISVLRDRYPYHQFPDGVALALTKAAIVAKQQRDSAAAKKPTGPGLRPAPGPAPIPGHDSTSTAAPRAKVT
jgi:hypothetical protein